MDQKNTFEKNHRLTVLVLAVASVFLIRYIQHLAGPEFAFSFLYLVLIAIVTWVAGLFWGMIISVVSAFSWLLVDLSVIERFSHPYVPLINESLRLSVFVCMVVMINRYRMILEKHKELAAIDPLTGAANRRAFFRLAKTEIDRSRRYGHPFSIMVMDIDNFKQINDHFGHHTGDRLLVKVVETLRYHLRAIDIVARFGGDEFVVLLVRTEEKSALRVVDKLLKKLQAAMQDNRWDVTFSMGVAVYHSVPDTVDETLRAADALMYEVKHGGKDGIRHRVIT